MLIVIKVIYFQALWYLSVFLGARSLHWLALFLCLISLGLDYLVFRYPNVRATHYVYFVLALVLFGFGFDLAFTYSGLIGWTPGLFYPASLMGVWIIFATYYPSIFSKFDGRPILSFILGALFGPFAYWSGAQIGAIEYTIQETSALVFHMIGWGLFFSLSIHFFQFIKREVPHGNC